jgi:hypothetical protein
LFAALKFLGLSARSLHRGLGCIDYRRATLVMLQAFGSAAAASIYWSPYFLIPADVLDPEEGEVIDERRQGSLR